jgi:hypothetical protein
MKIYGEWMISALIGGEWLAPRPYHFTPAKEPRVPIWKDDGVGPRADLDDMDPTGTRTPTSRTSSPLPIAIPTELPRLMLTLSAKCIRTVSHFPIGVTSHVTQAVWNSGVILMPLYPASPAYSISTAYSRQPPMSGGAACILIRQLTHQMWTYTSIMHRNWTISSGI